MGEFNCSLFDIPLEVSKIFSSMTLPFDKKTN